MGTESEKYRKIIKQLQQSAPQLRSPDVLEMKVMEMIKQKKRRVLSADSVMNFFFGWAYIGWVRRSLITASIILVAFFVWQQTIILRQLNFLNNRIEVTGIDIVRYQPRMDEKKLLMMHRGGVGFSDREIVLSEEKLKELLDSYSKVQSDYSELLKLINEDPELKKMLKEKAEQKNLKKVKL